MIFYANRTGIAWRYLLYDFPPHRTVHGYFAAWTKEGILAELNYQLAVQATPPNIPSDSTEVSRLATLTVA